MENNSNTLVSSHQTESTKEHPNERSDKLNHHQMKDHPSSFEEVIAAADSKNSLKDRGMKERG